MTVVICPSSKRLDRSISFSQVRVLIYSWVRVFFRRHFFLVQKPLWTRVAGFRCFGHEPAPHFFLVETKRNSGCFGPFPKRARRRAPNSNPRGRISRVNSVHLHINVLYSPWIACGPSSTNHWNGNCVEVTKLWIEPTLFHTKTD